MAKVPGNDKVDGNQFSAAEYNTLKSAINALYDALFNGGIIGSIKTDVLPDGILSTNQFETLSDNSIGIKTSYLQSLNLGGGTGTPTLSPPTIQATAGSTTQITVTWGSVSGATSYTLQRATQSNFSDALTVYTGSNLTYVNNGLIQATIYYYRVKATGAGYLDSNYAGTSATTQSSGAITPAAPTNFIVDDVNNTGDWTYTPGYTSISDYDQTFDGGLTTSQATAKPLPVGDIAKQPGQVGVRVKAASGRNASAWLFNQQPYTSTGGGTYIVEKTIRIDLTNEYAGEVPPDAEPYYNVLRPAVSLLQTANGYTSPPLVDDKNNATTITIKNTGAFSGSSGQISVDQGNAGNTGVYPNSVVNTSWNVSGSTNAIATIAGLDPVKYYQIYILMPVGSVPAVRGATINGVAKNKTATTVLGSFGVAGNGLNDPEFIVFNNIQGSAVNIALNRISGDYGAFCSLIVLEQTNIAK